MTHYKTESIKSKNINRQWWLIDATNQTLGRISSPISTILQGKDKPSYSPQLNCGDYVIIINAEKIQLTGKKMKNKSYISHTGYPGGQRTTTPQKLINDNQADRILLSSITRMLPKTKLRDKYLANLFIYTGATHKHTAQNPKIRTLR